MKIISTLRIRIVKRTIHAHAHRLISYFHHILSHFPISYLQYFLPQPVTTWIEHPCSILQLAICLNRGLWLRLWNLELNSWMQNALQNLFQWLWIPNIMSDLELLNAWMRCTAASWSTCALVILMLGWLSHRCYVSNYDQVWWRHVRSSPKTGPDFSQGLYRSVKWYPDLPRSCLGIFMNISHCCL